MGYEVLNMLYLGIFFPTAIVFNTGDSCNIKHNEYE